jgi:predicted dehydrogenase
MRMLLGEYTVTHALGGALGDLGLQVEDTAEVGLRFENGAVGSIRVDYLQQPPTHTLEIAGTGGTLRWNNADGSLAHFRAGAADWQTYYPPEGFERNWLFLEEMRNFIAAAHGKAEPLCTLADGARALEIVLQARRCLE